MIPPHLITPICVVAGVFATAVTLAYLDLLLARRAK